MKHLNTYITEYIIKKKLDKPIDSEDHYKYFPKTREELIENIKELINNKIYDELKLSIEKDYVNKILQYADEICKKYEINKGETDKLFRRWIGDLYKEFADGKSVN